VPVHIHVVPDHAEGLSEKTMDVRPVAFAGFAASVEIFEKAVVMTEMDEMNNVMSVMDDEVVEFENFAQEPLWYHYLA